MDTVTITKELFDSLVMDKAREIAKEERNHCVSKERAMQILDVGESTFYKLKNKKGSHIRTGAKQGTFVKASILKERDRKD